MRAESDSIFRTVIAAMREGVVIQDQNDVILLNNDAACRILGLTNEQLRGLSSFDPRWRAVAEDGTPFKPEQHPSVVSRKTGKPVRDVMMGVHKPDGSLTWIRINSEPVFYKGASGKPDLVVVTFHDVTAEKLFTEKLARSDERYRLATEAGRVGTWEWDFKSNDVYWSDNIAGILGVDPDRFDGTYAGYLSLLPESTRDSVRQAIEVSVRNPEVPYKIEHSQIDTTGRTRFIEAAGRVIVENGEPARMVGTVTDRTELQEKARELELSREKYMLQIQYATEALVVYDMHTGLFSEVNPAAERMFALSRDELLRRGPAELSPPVQPDGRDSRSAAMEYLEAAMRGGITEFQWTHTTGAGVPFPCQIQLVRMPGHQVRGSIRDISQILQAERDLQEKSEELETFMVSTTHDLRSPIANVRGVSDLMSDQLDLIAQKLREKTPESLDSAEELLKSEVRPLIDLLRLTATRMDHLLTALITYQKTGSAELKLAKVDLSDALNKLAETYYPRLTAIGGGIQVQNLPVILADRDLILSVFSNLLDNSIKYRKDAEPLLISIRHEEGPGKSIVVVEDNGIGMNKRELAKVFNMFQRFAPDKAEGFGVGMSIVKKIMNKHSGRVSVQSEPGIGTRVMLHFRSV